MNIANVKDEIHEMIKAKYPDIKVTVVFTDEETKTNHWFSQNLNDMEFCYVIDTLRLGRDKLINQRGKEALAAHGNLGK